MTLRFHAGQLDRVGCSTDSAPGALLARRAVVHDSVCLVKRTDGERHRRSQASLLVALTIDNLGSGMFFPLVLAFSTQIVGLPISTASGVLFAGTLLGLTVPAIVGVAADRYGPRIVVVTSQIAQASGMVCYLVAGQLAGQAVSVPLVVAAAVLAAAGTQANCHESRYASSRTTLAIRDAWMIPALQLIVHEGHRRRFNAMAAERAGSDPGDAVEGLPGRARRHEGRATSPTGRQGDASGPPPSSPTSWGSES
jgi:hypothetical protein